MKQQVEKDLDNDLFLTGGLTPGKRKLDKEFHSDFRYEISREDQALRLDLFLASWSLDISRSRIQELIRKGAVEVNQGPFWAELQAQVPAIRIRITIPPPSPRALSPNRLHSALSMKTIP